MSTATTEDPCRLNRNLSSFAVTDGLCTESMNLHSALLICTVDVDYIDDRTPHIHNSRETYTKIIQTWTILYRCRIPSSSIPKWLPWPTIKRYCGSGGGGAFLRAITAMNRIGFNRFSTTTKPLGFCLTFHGPTTTFLRQYSKRKNLLSLCSLSPRFV